MITLESLTTMSTASPPPAIPGSGNGAARPEAVFGLPLATRPWAVFLEITPERAAKLLTFNTGNRGWAPTNVANFAHLMRTGQFLTTHQGIAFDDTGVLIDGQNRLMAVVETGMPVIMQVNFGMPSGTFGALDRGKVRTIADDLVVSGVSHGYYANVLQAAARVTFHLDAGRFPWTQQPKLTIGGTRDSLQRHRHLISSAEMCASRGGSPRIPPGSTAAFIALFREVDDEAGLLFHEQLITGAGLGEGHPVLILRNSMSRQTDRQHAAGRNAFMVRMVRAWNNLREKRSISVLNGVMRDDKFPRIAGQKYDDAGRLVGRS
jgi:hypothetical protein